MIGTTNNRMVTAVLAVTILLLYTSDYRVRMMAISTLQGAPAPSGTFIRSNLTFDQEQLTKQFPGFPHCQCPVMEHLGAVVVLGVEGGL